MSLPIVYFCQWLDSWLMGDLVPGLSLLCKLERSVRTLPSYKVLLRRCSLVRRSSAKSRAEVGWDPSRQTRFTVSFPK